MLSVIRITTQALIRLVKLFAIFGQQKKILMKKSLTRLLNKTGGFAMVTAFMLLQISCNKTNDAALKSSANSVTPASLQQKVLFIIVDGAMGTEAKLIAPPVLTGLTNHAIFSWNGLTGYTNTAVTNSSTWTTLLTGVNNDKHGVANSMSSANLVAYPTVFTRLKTVAPALRSVALTSVDSLKTALAGGATVANSFGGDDAATNTAALAEIKNNNPDLLLVQFHAVDVAGANGGYSAGSAAYKAAMLQTDTYIGQLINAVKSRANYVNENWLFVITSNKGSNTGIPDNSSWSAFDDNRHNTFAFYYNPRFVPKTAARPVGILPYAGVTPNYTIGSNGTSNNAAYVPNARLNGALNFGPGAEFTMQCKIKFPTGGYNYPAFLGKKPLFDDASTGFLFFIEGSDWQVTTKGSISSRQQSRGTTVMDGQWHTLTGVVRYEAGVRRLIAFTDGAKTSAAQIKTLNVNDDFTNPADFVAGSFLGNASTVNNCLITDIRIYRTALSDTYIGSNYCSVQVLPTDTATSKLIAYWPSTQIITNTDPNNGLKDSLYLQDYGPNNFKLIMKSKNQSSFNDKTDKLCPPISVASYVSVPNNADALPVIFSWFNFPIPASWNLDGKVWIPSYNDLIN